MKKRIMSLLFCLIMVMSILPMSAFAEGDVQPTAINYYTVRVNDDLQHLDLYGDGQYLATSTSTVTILNREPENCGSAKYGIAEMRNPQDVKFENPEYQAKAQECVGEAMFLYGPALSGSKHRYSSTDLESEFEIILESDNGSSVNVNATKVCGDCNTKVTMLLKGAYTSSAPLKDIFKQKCQDHWIYFERLDEEPLGSSPWADLAAMHCIRISYPHTQNHSLDPKVYTVEETAGDDSSIKRLHFYCTVCGVELGSYETPSRNKLVGMLIPIEFYLGSDSVTYMLKITQAMADRVSLPLKQNYQINPGSGALNRAGDFAASLTLTKDELQQALEEAVPQLMALPELEGIYKTDTDELTVELIHRDGAQQWQMPQLRVAVKRVGQAEFKAEFIGEKSELRPDSLSLSYSECPELGSIVLTKPDFKKSCEFPYGTELNDRVISCTLPEGKGYVDMGGSYDSASKSYTRKLVLPDNAKLQVHILKPLTTAYPFKLNITDDVVSWDGERQLSFEDSKIGDRDTHIVLNLNLEDSAVLTAAEGRLPITRYKQDGSLTEHKISYKVVNTDNQADVTELFTTALEPMNEDRTAKLFLVENDIKSAQVSTDTPEGLPADFKIKLGLKAKDGTVLSEPAEAEYNNGDKTMKKEFSFPYCPVGETYAPYEFDKESITIEDMDKRYVLSDIDYDGATFYVKVQKYVSPTVNINGQLVFSDLDNVKGIRPQNPKLQLMRGLKKDLSDAVPVGEPVAVDASGLCSFGAQPKTDELQNPYVYSLQVPGLDSRYRLNQTASPSGNNIRVSVRANLPLMDIRVNKTWETDGPVPQNVVVELYEGDKKVAEAELLNTRDEKKQYCEFENLFIVRDENGRPGYTLKERTPDGFYLKSQSKFVPDPAYETLYVTELVNAEIPTIDIKVNKVWKNTVEPKDYVEIKLTADGKELSDDWVKLKKEVNSADNKPCWSYTFEDMPTLTKEGKEIKYSVVEKEIKNFKTEVSAMNQNNEITITNTHIDKGVKTGDESNIGLWIGIAAAALVVIAAVVIVVIKKSKKDESDQDQNI